MKYRIALSPKGWGVFEGEKLIKEFATKGEAESYVEKLMASEYRPTTSSRGFGPRM